MHITNSSNIPRKNHQLKNLIFKQYLQVIDERPIFARTKSIITIKII